MSIGQENTQSGWSDDQLIAAQIKPKHRETTPYGDVLIGERLNGMALKASKEAEWEVWWFWRQGRSKLGRKITIPVFLPDGQLVVWENRKKLAMEDAMTMIPVIASGAELYQEYRNAQPGA